MGKSSFPLAGVIAAVAIAGAVDIARAQPAGPPPGGGEPHENDPRLMEENINIGAVELPDTTETCGDEPGFARLLCLSELLKADVSDDILELMEQPYSVETAQKWSNLPAGGYPDRPGVLLGEFSEEQLGLVKAILMEAGSLRENEGYDEIEQNLNLDDFIYTVATDQAGYSSSNFYFAFLGTPAESGTWELYYGGHHFAFANTYTDGVLVGATPSFRGVEPFRPVEFNDRLNLPMAQERDAFARLLQSLTEEQREAALLEGTYRDILAGPQADDAIPEEKEGLSVSELSDEQVYLLIAALETYVGDINDAGAAAYMEKYEAEFADTYLGFSGTTDLDSEDDYVRLHGPSLWLEFSMQSNKSTGEEGNHPHSVWRDQQDDYGGNTL